MRKILILATILLSNSILAGSLSDIDNNKKTCIVSIFKSSARIQCDNDKFFTVDDIYNRELKRAEAYNVISNYLTSKLKYKEKFCGFTTNEEFAIDCLFVKLD